MRPGEIAFVLAGLLLAGRPVAASERFVSGPRQAGLIELYTSEGCSSCPPAEAWFSSLSAQPVLWKSIVPVAFHVTFWDNDGWTDRWAKPSYTDREHAYAAAWHSSQVYTPCFVVNGAEWRPDSGRLAWPAREGGRLTVEVQGRDVTIRYEPPAAMAGQRFAAHAALLGMGLRTRVRGGENSGATLTHDFLALALLDAALRGDAATLRLPEPSAPGRHALAVWITAGKALAPLQAAGGWLTSQP